MQSAAGTFPGIVHPIIQNRTGTQVNNIESFRVIPAPDNDQIAFLQAAQGIALASPGRITVDPQIRGGVPCIGEGRWPIAHILQALGSGATFGQVLKERPDLTLADIQLVLDIAAWVMRDPAINWSKLNLQDMADFQDEIRAWENLSDDSLEQSDD